MKLGLQSLQFLSSPDRPLADQIDEFVPVCREAEVRGFDWVSASQHWLSGPTVWPQPFPLIAHLAAASDRIRFMTQMLLLPLHNPVDIAEQVATLDHVCRGRLDLGIALGYREAEMTAAGISRSDRVGRLEEGLEVLRQMWSGEDVSHDGKWWQVPGGRMGFTPYQKPHPPIVMAAQSRAATSRAARLADGVFFGPQIKFADLARLADIYRDEAGRFDRVPGVIGAGRALIIGESADAALESARSYVAKTYGMYSGWDMQEPGMAPLALAGEDVRDWALVGTPHECVESVVRLARDAGVGAVTLTLYNLPPDPRARLDQVHRVGEEIVRPVKQELGGSTT